MLRFLRIAVTLTALLAPHGLLPGPEMEERDRVHRFGGSRNPSAAGGLGLAHLPVGTSLPFVPTRRTVRGEGDVQVNDAAADRFFDFPSASPPVEPLFCTNQSESSLAVHGSNVVVTYNTSAGFSLKVDGSGKVAWDQALSVGFSFSADGGRTFRSGFLPRLGGLGTYADNAVDVDRNGRFYAMYLSDSAGPAAPIVVTRSDDGGATWNSPVPAATDPRTDKMFLAVGPDPVDRDQDNVYVTWTSFFSGGSSIRLVRSRDGAKTFSGPSVVYKPSGFEPGLGTYVQESTPFVDLATGRLYVAFAHLTSQTWWVRLAKSEDAGETFSLMNFGFPGAAVPTAIPAVQPGHYADCGSSKFWVLHSGPDSRSNGGAIPRYRQAWWLGYQPFVAAHGDLVAVAWATSTSADPYDQASGSRVLLTVSRDGGFSWTPPYVVHPESVSDPQHVEPALAIDAVTRDIQVSYYVQHADGSIDVELATLGESDAYSTFRTKRLTSIPSTIPPSVVVRADQTVENTDAIVSFPCYSLGHYMQVRADNGTAFAAWTDARNTFTHATNPLDPLSGQTHSQADVYFRAVRP